MSTYYTELLSQGSVSIGTSFLHPDARGGVANPAYNGDRGPVSGALAEARALLGMLRRLAGASAVVQIASEEALRIADNARKALANCMTGTDLLLTCPFRKLHPAWIGTVGQNHRIIFSDDCDPAHALAFRR